MQVENEYGSYNKDPAYMPYIKKVSASLVRLFTIPPLECSVGCSVTAALLILPPHLSAPFVSEGGLSPYFISVGLPLISPLLVESDWGWQCLRGLAGPVIKESAYPSGDG